MKKDRTQQTEYLFREIGGIDDRYLAEAMSYRPRKALPRVLVAAACLALCGALLITLPLMARRSQDDNDPPTATTVPTDTAGNSGGSQGNDPDMQPLAQDTLLLDLRDQLGDAATEVTAITVVSDADALSYFSQSVHVVWSYGDDSAIYVSPALSDDQFTRLSQTITSGTRVDADRNQPVCKIWITLGNGEVITPYLQQSSGNTGACELFDYNAELLPSSEFCSCLSEILQ